jgi:protein tyrosine phosphatase (PTP) superfamily phosphohydrolase (DUF442 family)
MSKFDVVPIRNFSRASASMFRGAAPDEKGIKFLRSLGVKTIVDLRRPSFAGRREAMHATRYGVNYYNIPIGYVFIPDAIIAAFLAITLHPRYQPVFVHCTDGRDVTGAMVAIFRVAVEGWPFEWPYADMRAKGFHRWQLPLKLQVKQFAERMMPLNVDQRLYALKEMVEQNLFTA